MGARTIVSVRDGQPVTLFYAAKNPASGAYYDNTKITAVAASVRRADGTEIAALALAYSASLDGYVLAWSPGALLDGLAWAVVKLTPTRVGVPAALVPSREIELDLSDLAKRQDEIQSDTDDIQARLPASLVGGRMRSHVEALDADVITASSIAAGAITASEAPALGNLDAAVSTRATPADVASARDVIRGADLRDLSQIAGAGFSATDSLRELSLRLTAVQSALTSAGADVVLLRKALVNRLEETPGAPGSLVLYDDDAVTPLKTWALRDFTGAATVGLGGAPARRAAAT